MNEPVLGERLHARLQRARETMIAALMRERGPAGHWEGELSSSALSTATAVVALTLVARGEAEAANAGRWRGLIARGFAWLIRHQNSDGGWGDTTRSLSNLSTTVLVWSALGMADEAIPGVRATIQAAENGIERAAGSLEPARLVAAIEQRYGDDRTFSIPILTMAALCGRLGPKREAWARVRQLPFEIAVLPQTWFGALRLPVVSYALPALIAIGHVRHGLQPTTNPVLRALRNGCRERTLRKLAQLQPENGGFLEATPLTSFVTMSLAALGLTAHPVVRRGVAFVEASAREDGSWPIDTHLATWVTTLAVNALGGGEAAGALTDLEKARVRDWLVRQQYRTRHPYTQAAPGGWAWTDRAGGVPDADDTAGAILALLRLDPANAEVSSAVTAGVTWLLDLQNGDGGIPTFCRGWGKLAFDRSSPDLTAHALRGWTAARDRLSARLQRRVNRATGRALGFLRESQRSDGPWIPLWFGNQDHPAEENPVYGTSRVLLALASLDGRKTSEIGEMIERATTWVLQNQRADGGWGGNGEASSIEETALALEALAETASGRRRETVRREEIVVALRRGGEWLATAVEEERWKIPAPIGLYFAKLWYFERLYPLIFATAALTQLTK